jgi:hypothetical protein
MISQIFIMILGVTAIWLVGLTKEYRKWGYVFGLCAQPFWIVWSINTEAWGILVLTLFYKYSWAKGIYNFIIKPKINKKNEI